MNGEVILKIMSNFIHTTVKLKKLFLDPNAHKQLNVYSEFSKIGIILK